MHADRDYRPALGPAVNRDPFRDLLEALPPLGSVPQNLAVNAARPTAGK